MFAKELMLPRPAGGAARCNVLVLRPPLLVFALLVLTLAAFPGVLLWVLIEEREGLTIPVILAFSLLLVVSLTMAARIGAIVDDSGIRLRGVLSGTRAIPWTEIEDIHVQHGYGGRLPYIRLTSGELVPIMGVPTWRYRRQNSRTKSGWLVDIPADLRGRLAAARE